MRVLQLTTDLRFAGAERVIVNLARGLRVRGIDCAVAGLFKGGRPVGRTAQVLRREGFPVYCAGIERKWMAWRLAGLRRFVLDWQPDLLHCHMFHGNAAGALLRNWSLRCPLLWTHHGREGGALRRSFYRLAGPLPDCQVYVSRAMRSYYRGVAGRARREGVIQDGIDLKPYRSVQPRSGPVFGALGRLIPEKGFDVLIRAFARLAGENETVELRIAGDGPQGHALRKLIGRYGLEGRAELVGFVEDVPGFLGGISVFVMPSRREGFGLALVEALAAGLPCVASRVDSLAEVGGDAVTWVPPEDAGALYRAMKRQVDSPVREGQVRARRERALRFSRRRMTDAYLRLYRCLLE